MQARKVVLLRIQTQRVVLLSEASHWDRRRPLVRVARPDFLDQT